jgi:type IV secretion system protein VirB10
MEKLEKQVNEAEAERLISKWFTKRTVLCLVGVIAVLYIWLTTRGNHAHLPQGPIPQALAQPAAIPKTSAVSIPRPVVVDDPRQDPRVGVPYPQPTVAQREAEQPRENQLEKLREDHRQREHESAFASMMAVEETKQAVAAIKQPPESTRRTEEERDERSATSAQPMYIIPQGTIAPLALDSRLEGEMSGPMDAHFTEDVYLPGTRTLVIPQGSKAIGQTVQVGNTNQRRIAITFTKVQRDPANRACDITLSEPALDEAGSVGVTGKVDTHLGSTIFGSVLTAVLQGASVGVVYGGGGGYGPGQVMMGGVANGGAQTAGRLLDKWTNKLPRITVQEGNRLSMPFLKDTPISVCGESE